MTFSRAIKEEIFHLDTTDEQLEYEIRAILIGLTTINHTDSGIYLVVESTYGIAIRKVLIYLKKKYPELETRSLVQRKKRFKETTNMYILEIYGDVKQMMFDLELIDDKNVSFIFGYSNLNKMLPDENEMAKRAFIRMYYCAVGTVNDPRNVQQYHLEFTMQNEELAKILQKILQEVDINFKISKRARNLALYLNKSEEIADFLKYTGITNGLFEFEDYRLTRDIHATNNRINNAEIANEIRQQKNSIKQIEAIEYLKKENKLKLFKEKTREIAELRVTNPEVSLAELAELSTGISKSNIRHHLKKITDKYEELQLNNKGEK